jgi:hypothetical protein
VDRIERAKLRLFWACIDRDLLADQTIRQMFGMHHTRSRKNRSWVMQDLGWSANTKTSD